MALEGEQYGIKANLVNPGAAASRRDRPVDEIPGVNGDDIRDNFLPGRVSPMVACSRAFMPMYRGDPWAGGGRFARSTITTAKGWVSEACPPARTSSTTGMRSSTRTTRLITRMMSWFSPTKICSCSRALRQTYAHRCRSEGGWGNCGPRKGREKEERGAPPRPRLAVGHS